jgi:hypothetical protein
MQGLIGNQSRSGHPHMPELAWQQFDQRQRDFAGPRKQLLAAIL